ncbi:MAG: extracellular solute-binding protein [Anaerolineae bacterium]
MRFVRIALFMLLATILVLSVACGSSGSDEPVTLRLEVSLTPQELATFEPAIQALDEAHPEWVIVLETTPQSGLVEKINTQLAGDDLPDVVRSPGLFVQQWIRQEAFLDLSDRIEEDRLDLGDFYAGPLEQFRWQDKLWGLPDTAAPSLVYYNKDIFDAAGLAYPTDDWTYQDMRRAALQLTLDAEGRTPADPDFDPESIQQWGWNAGWTNIWQRHLVQAFGGDLCVNDDCTLMTFTSPETIQAADWWFSLSAEDHATLFDPYGGSQTGVPGDPFIAGKAAMGYNGFFAVGQLNDAGGINYDVAQPFLGVDGRRSVSLSTNGYLVSARTEHPDQAWALVSALLSPDFLAETWGQPGHSVPARRSVADSVINLEHPPANQQVIVAAMEYANVFKPHTASAFEAYARTSDLFAQAARGELSPQEAMTQIEQTANEVLSRDRE